MIRRIKYLLLITVFFTVLILILQSCIPEDLGLPISNNDTVEAEAQEQQNGSQLTGEEFFLQMKAKQDKNPLSNIDIRKAIFHAVDRSRITEEIFNGYNDISNSIFAEGTPFWEPAWAGYDYDLQKAEEFLAKAGFGKDNPLYITIRAVDNSSSRKLIEDIVREDLEKIGINLWVYNDPPKEFYQNHIYNGDFDLGLWSLYISGHRDIENSFSSSKIPSMETGENTCCENFYWYSNTSMDDAIARMASLEDPAIKSQTAKEIQETLAKDAVILPLYSRLFVFAYDDELESAGIQVAEDKFFYSIEDWTLSSGREITEEEITEIAAGYSSDNIDIFNGFGTYFINDLLFKGLWKKNSDGSYSPELAEELSGLQDDMIGIPGNNINIKLKEDIYWHDGDPITSEDVVYTFEYFRAFMEEKQYFSNLDADYSRIKEINIVNEKSFTIVFEEPVKDWKKLFPQVFKKDQFSPVDHYSLPYTSIVSNGPYKVASYDDSGEMVLEINEYYHNEVPEIGRLIIRFDPDINNLIAMLKEGEINFLSIPVDPELMRTLEEENDMKLLIEKGNLVEHLALSLKPKEG
jgi:ABC-type transport system substrate-binding protein